MTKTIKLAGVARFAGIVAAVGAFALAGVAYAATSTPITFSPTSVSVANGGSQTVAVTGGNGEYYISGNTNSSAVSVGTINTGIIVAGLTPGSGTVSLCDTSNTNTCGTISVTVGGSTTTSSTSTTTTTNTSQAVTFSVASPSLTVGQTLSDALSGLGTTYFVTYNQNSGIVQATIDNSTNLSLYGVTAGSDLLTVCAMGGAGCSQITVAVTGSGTATTPTTITTTATTPTPTVTPTTTTEPTSVALPPAGVVANSALLSEIQTLQSALTLALTQMQSMQAQLNLLQAQVTAGSGSGIGTSAGASVSSGSTGTFTEFLTVGSEDDQVTALQTRLTALGFYSGGITGYFGTLTQQAVTKYQTAHGIETTGSVGPNTRAALNAGN